MSDWTPELKQEVIDAYVSKDPTPENTMDLVNDLAEDFDKTPNSIRRILSQENVYVSKGKVKAAGKDKSAAPARVSKADSINALSDAIEQAGVEADSEILGKLTGKAAIYFTSVVAQLQRKGED